MSELGVRVFRGSTQPRLCPQPRAGHALATRLLSAWLRPRARSSRNSRWWFPSGEDPSSGEGLAPYGTVSGGSPRTGRCRRFAPYRTVSGGSPCTGRCQGAHTVP